jgi:transketolase C-terminal domain/subunit
MTRTIGFSCSWVTENRPKEVSGRQRWRLPITGLAISSRLSITISSKSAGMWTRSSTKEPSARHAFTQTITDLASKHPEIYTVTSDARGSVTLTDFAELLPDQFVEVGIAEQNATGIAAGLALSGKSVFLCGPASFYSARSVEQVKNDIAYAGANVKVIGVSGGVSYGALGSTHHSLHDIALYRRNPLPMRIIGFPDEFLPAGSSQELFEHFGIEKQAIAAQVMEALQ